MLHSATPYGAAIALIKGLSLDVCSFVTGRVTQFAFSDEEELATNLTVVREAAGPAAEAAELLPIRDAASSALRRWRRKR